MQTLNLIKPFNELSDYFKCNLRQKKKQNKYNERNNNNTKSYGIKFKN